MGMIRAEKLVFEYDKRDEDGNVIGSRRAIDGVDIDIPQGSFVAVLGHNGSGKSTVSSIISGIQKADEGSVFYQGKEFKPENILDANKHNICMIVQEQSTVTTISVAANIFIGKEDMFSKGGVVDRRKMEAEAQKVEFDQICIDHEGRDHDQR